MSSVPDAGRPGELNLFHYQDREVRTVIINGNPWFVAMDVCDVLGIADGRSSVRLLDDDEKGVHSVHTPGGDQRLSIINEPGLYSLILRSRKPEAKAFKRWVTHEVLPALRRGGEIVERPRADISPLEVLRDTVVHLCEVRDKANMALEMGEENSARLDALEGHTGGCVALVYARKHNLPTDEPWLAKLGKAASRVARAAGIEPSYVPHPRYTHVNSFPEWIWAEAVESLSKAA
jgi:prophage antirepressor-like protein